MTVTQKQNVVININTADKKKKTKRKKTKPKPSAKPTIKSSRSSSVSPSIYKPRSKTNAFDTNAYQTIPKLLEERSSGDIQARNFSYIGKLAETVVEQQKELNTFKKSSRSDGTITLTEADAQTIANKYGEVVMAKDLEREKRLVAEGETEAERTLRMELEENKRIEIEEKELLRLERNKKAREKRAEKKAEQTKQAEEGGGGGGILELNDIFKDDIQKILEERGK